MSSKNVKVKKRRHCYSNNLVGNKTESKTTNKNAQLIKGTKYVVVVNAKKQKLQLHLWMGGVEIKMLKPKNVEKYVGTSYKMLPKNLVLSITASTITNSSPYKT